MIIKIQDSKSSINSAIEKGVYIVSLDIEKIKEHFIYFDTKLEEKILSDEVDIAPSNIDFFTNYKMQEKRYEVFYKPTEQICFVDVLNGHFINTVDILSIEKESDLLIFKFAKKGNM